VKLTTALLLCLVSAGTAAAQSPAVLAKKNAAFLRGLYRCGYIDLAKSMAEVVQKVGSQPSVDEKKALASVMLDIQLEDARRDGDAKRRIDLILESLKKKEELLAAQPDSREAAEARSELGEFYRQLADSIAAALQEEKDPAAASAIRKQGDEVFKQAEESLQVRVDALDVKRQDSKGDPVEDVVVQHMIAMYGQCKTFYLHSTMFPPTAVDYKKNLERALAKYDEFELEYGDRLLGYESLIDKCMVQKALGNIDDAIGSLDDAIKLRDNFPRNPSGHYPMPADVADVVSAAFAQKVKTLTELKKLPEAIAAAKEYLATTPDPLTTSHGLGVLAAQAEAYLDQGENQEAQKLAQKLVDADPRGRWGLRGQELLGKLQAGGSKPTIVDVGTVLRRAEEAAGRGESELALQFCRQALETVKGSDKVEVGADALLIMGAIYAQRGWLQEASVAFEAVSRRFGKSQKVADAMWKNILCHSQIFTAEPYPYYRNKLDELSKAFRAAFPNNVNVASLQLLEAKQLEAAQKYVEAAALFEKVTPDSPVYLEARERAGNCYLRQSRKFKGEEAKKLVTKAEDTLKEILTGLESARKGTLEASAKAKIDQLDFNARLLLANMYLTMEPPRSDDAGAVLKPIEAMAATDPERNAQIVALRVRSLVAGGKVDEAETLLDGAMAKSPEARSFGPAAGALARAIDQRAKEQRKQGLRTSAADVWRKAINYYLLSVKERADQQPSKAEDLLQVANRLFAIGLDVNNIDTKVDSFFEVPDLKPTDVTPWEHAAELYERVLQTSPTWQTRLALARVDGFLRRWGDAETSYAQVLAERPVVDAKNNRLDPKVLKAFPELLNGYLESGFAAREAAIAAKDTGRLSRASEVFDRVSQSVPDDSKQWWYARYGQIRTLFDRGAYEPADLAMRGIERTNPNFDNDKFNCKLRFTGLKQEIALKVKR